MSDDTSGNHLVPATDGLRAGGPPHPLDQEWYVHLDSQTFGPYSGHKIREFVREGRVGPETDVLRKGSEEWKDAITDRALAPLFGGKAATVPAVRPTVSGPVSAAAGATVVQVTNTIAERAPTPVLFEDGPARPKSAGTALVLSILLVGLGQFYNGQVGKGILMIVLCIGLWFVLLGWIINIWSWIDAYQTASRMNERYYRRIAAGMVV